MIKRIRRIVLIFVCGLVFCDLSAQNFEWANKGEALSIGSQPSIAVDPSGNSYMYGTFPDTCTFGSFSAISYGGRDLYVCKYNSSGIVQWLIHAGSTIDDNGNGICAVAIGNIYITGGIGDTANFGGIILKGPGTFIAKYNSTGSIIWAQKVDSLFGNCGNNIIVGDSGSLFLTGRCFSPTNFVCGVSSFSNQADFIARYDTSGNCQWLQTVNCYFNDIAVDKSNNIYLTGPFYDSVYFGSTVLYSVGGTQDFFLVKCNPNGTWGWAIGTGSPGNDSGQGISIDPYGHIYVTGAFSNNVSFGCAPVISTGNVDIFISRYDTSGNCIWTQQAGGGVGQQYATSIASDKDGNCTITGSILDSTHFGNFTLIPPGENMYAAKYDSAGTCGWAVMCTGSSGQRGTDLQTDSIGNIYIPGTFTAGGTHIFGSFSLTSTDYGFTFVKRDNFIVKINNIGTGIPNLQSSSFNLQLFPNPTTGTIQLTLPVRQAGISTKHNAPLECEIINMMGERVFTSPLIPLQRRGEAAAQLDVSFLAKGIYLVRVGEGERWENKKLVVE